MTDTTAFRAPALPAILLAMSIFRGAPAGEPSDAGKMFQERTFVYAGGPYKEHPFRYRLLVPADYDPEAKAKDGAKERRWPLILFLHGAGERGDDNKAQLKYFPTDMASPENRVRYPCFLLAPQCPADRSWSNLDWRTLDAGFGPEPVHEARAVLLILEKVLDEFPVDRDRLYLTGLSMGGYGSWDLAARYPGKWAAVVPICGGADLKTAPRIKHIPIWVFHGAKDPVVKVERSRKMVEALKAAGGSPRYTEFPEAGHDAWTPGCRLPEFLPWLFAQKRESSVSAD